MASIAAINSAICTGLQGAGEVGLHVNDIEKLSTFGSRKEVQARLYDLQNKGTIQRLPGNKWRLTAAANGTSEANAPAAVPVDTHPAIKLPGISGFSSYKNSLQEYCQKLKFGVPQYRSETTNAGCFSTLSFANNTIVSTVGRVDKKEADQQVAFEALISLEYLPQNSVFQAPIKPVQGQKRKDPPTGGMADQMDFSEPAQKMAMPETNQFKSRLNELAQKSKIPQPEYETVTTPGGFFTTVMFNGRPFKSSKMSQKKKSSEQNAAHMAMYVLKQVPTPPEGYNPGADASPNGAAIDSMIAEARATTAGPPNATTASAKNKLQEFVQQQKMETMPKYTTDIRADKSVISTVLVANNAYTGDVSLSKKAAEQSAALKALMGLGVASKTATASAEIVMKEV